MYSEMLRGATPLDVIKVGGLMRKFSMQLCVCRKMMIYDPVKSTQYSCLLFLCLLSYCFLIFSWRQWPVWRRSRYWSAPTRTRSSVTTPTSPSLNLVRRRCAKRTSRSFAPLPSNSKPSTRRCRNATNPSRSNAMVRVQRSVGLCTSPHVPPSMWRSSLASLAERLDVKNSP